MGFLRKKRKKLRLERFLREREREERIFGIFIPILLCNFSKGGGWVLIDG